MSVGSATESSRLAQESSPPSNGTLQDHTIVLLTPFQKQGSICSRIYRLYGECSLKGWALKLATLSAASFTGAITISALHKAPLMAGQMSAALVGVGAVSLLASFTCFMFPSCKKDCNEWVNNDLLLYGYSEGIMGWRSIQL